MTIVNVEPYLHLLPEVRNMPRKHLWVSYDEEANVLYINFEQPSTATDSELTDDDVIVRYSGDDVIGFTILNASKREVDNRTTETP